MHDGTVWTISSDRNAALRINARIDEFDTLIREDMRDASLYQDGTSVYLQTPEGFAQMNSVGTNLSDVMFAEIDPDSQIGVAGGAAALLASDGGLWVLDAATLSGIDLQEEPTYRLAAGSQLAVTPDGFAIVLDPADDMVTVVENRTAVAERGDDLFVAREPVPFGHDVPIPGSGDEDFVFTAVGDVLVALLSGELLIPGLVPISVGGAIDEMALQRPGMSASEVLYADAETLRGVDLADGSEREIAEVGAGPAAAPVVVGGCAYAGWEGNGRVWVSCADGDDVQYDVDEPRGTNWIFRVNRDQVVLEAKGTDPKHITAEGLVAIDNWLDFESDLEEEDENDSEEQPDEDEQAVCRDVHAPPEAMDDEFGTAPGVAIMVRVLDNDRGPDCDPIAIVPVDDWNESWGSIALIENGQALQYTPADGFESSFSFSYTIDDGYGGDDSATTSVSVAGGTNRPPAKKYEGRDSETIVELFRTVTYNVLLDWEDPDGDTLLLEGALVNAGDGTIAWSQDGTIVYTATDTVAGPKEIAFTVGDGHGNVEAGVLDVSVQGEGVPLPPTARDDYAQAPVGLQVVVEPLLDDTDPDRVRAALSLASFRRAKRERRRVRGDERSQQGRDLRSAPRGHVE